MDGAECMTDGFNGRVDTVPEALTKLVKLEKLELSMNHLTGARLETHAQCSADPLIIACLL